MYFDIKNEIIKRIKSTKDINDLYAYLDNIKNCNYLLNFENDNEENVFNEMYENINYIVGVYDIENVKKLLGCYYNHEKDLLKKN